MPGPPPYFVTPPLSIIDAPADEAHDGGPRTLPITEIVLHATAGTNSLEWLTHTSPNLVSCHRLIDKKGRIYKILPDDHIANHAGYSRLGNRKNLNPTSLGLELENTNTGREVYPEVQVLSCAYQIAEWWSLYGPIPILSHVSVDTQKKTDPKGFPWDRFYQLLLAQIAPAFDTGRAITFIDQAQNALGHARLELLTNRGIV